MQAEPLSFLVWGFCFVFGTDFSILGKNDFLKAERFGGLARNTLSFGPV